MIYSIDFNEICKSINHIELVKYLTDLGWKSIPTKKNYTKIFQLKMADEIFQVNVPIDNEVADYGSAMFGIAKTLSLTQEKSTEQVVLELLNPMSDILRVRVANETTKDGSIFFEDAINLYENARKLVTAAAQDVTKVAKYHRGRPFDYVQEYVQKCRFGQTEFGSYVTNVVCPFYNNSEDKIVQMSLFEPESDCAHSLTRQVTNKIINSLNAIKNTIDEGGELEVITEADNNRVSINFLEAVQSLGIDREDSYLDIGIKWAPTIKENRAPGSNIILSHNYYEPIRAITKKFKKNEIDNTRKKYPGKITDLHGHEDLTKRKSGLVKFVSLDDFGNKKTFKAILSVDDYAIAVDAHMRGHTVIIEGEPDKEKPNQLIDCVISLL